MESLLASRLFYFWPMSTQIPPFLSAGDEVIIVAPANKVERKDMYAARDMLASWGLRVRFGQHLFSDYHRFSGSDEERISDLQAALDDAEAKAILCARGGYGTSRIVDQLQWQGFKKNPKWLVGFSDITSLHGMLDKLGYASLHATMPALMIRKEEQGSAESLRRALGGNFNAIEVGHHPHNRFGKAKTEVVGGNLSMLVHCLGTPSEVDTKGKILFIEDLDEYHYHIDRMMVQLKRAQKLERLAGLVVGTFSDLRENTVAFGKEYHEIIREHVHEYSYPVAFGFPIGHQPPNLALPFGMPFELAVTDSGAVMRLA